MPAERQKRAVGVDDMPKVISFSHQGNFKKTEKFFHKVLERHYMNKLHAFGRRGVKALSEATPVDTGKTAASWTYEIVEEENRLVVYWKNTNVNRGVNIALILQYGHATRNGGWIEGRDYINPAMQPIFDEMADVAWKEVVS